MIVYQDMHYPPADSIRQLHIHLPEGYGSSDERYPVTYMFDGHNLFFDEKATYGKSWGMLGFLSSWSKPMIVVGMECSHEGYERLDEYCPYPSKVMGYETHPKGEDTFRWIIDDVKPWVDSTFRTWGHREATAIAGSSMGAMMSLYGVVVHNDVFGKAAGISTGARRYADALIRDIRRLGVDPDTRVFFSWGESEMGGLEPGRDPLTESDEGRAVARVAAELERYGARTRAFFQAGGHHNEASWEKQVPLWMDFLWLEA
ncbi:MAG: alpha/beta hydrolase [Atopobiaceae bacterium]|nr:alpha/beta hydrolase [Atopobiaceae bacterium]